MDTNRVSTDPVTLARAQLAAAHRIATIHELEEGIDNHFTVTLPGHGDRYLVLPFGIHWSEARARDLFVFDEKGQTLQGEGHVELSARCIHAPIHRITGKRVVMHTHQTWAVALNMLKDNRVVPATQTAAFYCREIAYDDTYTGTADTLEEGERLARLMGDKNIVMMKNHGILCAGDTIAETYRRLYKMERICRTQVLAMATGRELNVLSEAVVDAVLAPAEQESHSREERDRLFFEAMMRIVDRELPGYNG
jgi:ribulose-5-phosphate 4-epimerase/fuculose-1-phosphate aldolase